MMAVFKLDGNKNQRCAFCKYWYDQTNQYIKPQDAKHGIWKFETTAMSLFEVEPAKGRWYALREI